MAVVKVPVGDLAASALEAGDPEDKRLALLLDRAVRFYLGERDSGQPGWRYPSFLGGSDRKGADREVVLSRDLWRQLRAEAERQDVTPENLLQHAAFYYATARDGGRLTARIAAELQREAEEEDEGLG